MNNTKLTIRLNEKEKSMLLTIARLNNISLSKLIRSLIDNYIDYISMSEEKEGK